jgi:hypothetical protein
VIYNIFTNWTNIPLIISTEELGRIFIFARALAFVTLSAGLGCGNSIAGVADF